MELEWWGGTRIPVHYRMGATSRSSHAVSYLVTSALVDPKPHAWPEGIDPDGPGFAWAASFAAWSSWVVRASCSQCLGASISADARVTII